MKISKKIITEMDLYIDNVFDKSPLFQQFKNGSMTSFVIAQYLYNVTNMVHTTIPHLEIAKKKALDEKNFVLAEYFEMKIQEETGHGKWGESDLGAIGYDYSKDSFYTMESMTNFLNYLEDLATNSIVDYAVYLFYGEYLTVRGGPKWLEYFDKYCPVDSKGISIIKNHVHLDVEHVHENIEFMDKLEGLGMVDTKNLHVINKVNQLYTKFFHEMSQMCEWDAGKRKDFMPKSAVVENRI